MSTLKTLNNADLEFFQSIVSRERFSTGESELDLHAHDESGHPSQRPSVVLWPLSTQEVSKIVTYANERKIPITPYAAGTSLEGNPIPVRGGIALDMRKMDQILEVHPQDLQVMVQPGLDFKTLNDKLKKHGLFFPPDPGATATIGGMVANNAKGIRAIKYGSTGDQVLSLEVVLPNGQIIKCGTRAMRTSSGYDLVRLFVGSEGTLGVITEVTLRLTGLPREFMAVVACFDSVEQATQTVVQMVQAGLTPAALEFIDTEIIQLVNRFKKMTMREAPTLFIEFQGSSRVALEDEINFVKELCHGNGCKSFAAGVGREERDRLWEARYSVHESIKTAYPGQHGYVVDVAVPISAYPEIVRFANEAIASRKLVGPAFGHAGEGNLHAEILYVSPREQALAKEANNAIVHKALDLGGTATGEHGVGIGKREFMQREHGASLELMRQIKNLFDPNGIMNPGKKI
ncbi:FAD-binding oxidoreductase [Candidatus Acetothermia bacterium]|nr:FAD-binding oxidoreductase [Candidatus Acetothermia bacterium]